MLLSVCLEVAQRGDNHLLIGEGQLLVVQLLLVNLGGTIVIDNRSANQLLLIEFCNYNYM